MLFISKIFLEENYTYLLNVVHGCFHITTAQLSSRNIDSVSYKAENIYR